MTEARARSIALITSYPRSGNTFLRALMANAASGLDRPLSLDAVASYGAGEKNEALWLACTGTPRERRTLEQEWRARAAYLARIRASPGEGPVIMKTHTFNGLAFGLEAFDLGPEDKVVYLTRHPLDVTLSASHFYGISQKAMADRMLLDGAFNAEDGLAPFEPTGSWTQNVAGWLNETRCPVFLLRYEDLMADPAGQLGRVLQFLGLRLDRERLEAAAAYCAFDVLRRSHEETGFDQGPVRDRKAPFFRRGRTDQWRTDLDPDIAHRLSTSLGELMDALKYERAPCPGEGAEGGPDS